MSQSRPAHDELSKAFETADALAAPLNQKLASFTEPARRAVPGVLDAYDRFVARLEASCAGIEATAVGETMPEFLLPDQDGRLVTLDSLLHSGPAVISFNRGHWCQYCRLELRALAKAYPAIAAAGARVVSIVPETAAFAHRLRQTDNLPFAVLSDIDQGYALAVGLVVWVGEEIKCRYTAASIDLALYQRNDCWLLPIPATYVVGRDRCVAARFIDPDFRRRLPIEQIIAVLRD